MGACLHSQMGCRPVRAYHMHDRRHMERWELEKSVLRHLESQALEVYIAFPDGDVKVGKVRPDQTVGDLLESIRISRPATAALFSPVGWQRNIPLDPHLSLHQQNIGQSTTLFAKMFQTTHVHPAYHSGPRSYCRDGCALESFHCPKDDRFRVVHPDYQGSRYDY